MTSKHITRDYSAHKKSVIRPYDEYVGLEIFSFDPEYTKIFLPENGTLKSGDNSVKTSWKSWSCYRVDNPQENMTFTIPYNVVEYGDYRIDFLYEQSNHIYGKTSASKDDTGADLTGEIHIESELTTVYDDTVLFDGENNVIKRKYYIQQLNTGKHNITISIPSNCYFMGVMIRKQITYYANNYYGDNHGKDDGNMMLTSASLTISDSLKPSEITCEIGYDDAFECYDSPSGFYIDYMDEMNYYVKDNDGEIQRVFGGYVTSILPDTNRTKLTIHGADRLLDSQNKYILDLIKMAGGEVSQSEDDYSENMTKYFNSYGQALDYLCNIHEVTLNSNIAKNFLVDGEKYNKGLQLVYGKKKHIKSVKASNGYSTIYDNFVELQNKPSSKSVQSWTLYDASKVAKTPPLLNNKRYLHITYGLGSPKTELKSKITEKVDVSDVKAGVQKFGKCGVSEDKKYVMGIGQYSSAKGHSGLNYQTIYKSVFVNKCPHCGKATLRWDSCRSDTKCIFTGNWNGTKGSWGGGIPETEITCTNCDSDYDSVTGYEKDSPWKKLTKVGKTVKSSKAEQTKLHKGKMTAIPKTGAEITPDDIFKAITKLAFKYKYKRGATGQTYNQMKKTGHGDCWGFSDLIFHELKSYGVSCKIVRYSTSQANEHRSVLYKNQKNKWVDFPYREYGWDERYNNNLNNTSGSKHGGLVEEFKGSNIGTVKSSGSTTKSQTTEITTTKNYDKDKPFQAYLRITYSLEPSFKAKKYNLNIKFTYNANVKNSINTVASFPLYWVNNTVKKSTLQDKDGKAFDLVSYIQNGDSSKNVYLQSIQLIAPIVPVTTDNKDTDWYKFDKSTKDHSSCKMRLYQIIFDDNQGVTSNDIESCGKTVNEMMKTFVDDSGYLVDMTYGLHRNEDRINFRVNNNTKPSFTATEGDNNNILSWNSISYSPINSLYNMSMQVFKDFNGQYLYVDTRDPTSIMKYQEQCTLQTVNESIDKTEAYYNARMNSKFNNQQTYTFTITVPNYPDLQLGDLVQVIANAKKLSTIKELQSIKITFKSNTIPRIQTELGLGELAPDIQLKKNIRDLRREAKKETTSFHGTAVPVDEPTIYLWDR